MARTHAHTHMWKSHRDVPEIEKTKKAHVSFSNITAAMLRTQVSASNWNEPKKNNYKMAGLARHFNQKSAYRLFFAWWQGHPGMRVITANRIKNFRNVWNNTNVVSTLYRVWRHQMNAQLKKNPTWRGVLSTNLFVNIFHDSHLITVHANVLMWNLKKKSLVSFWEECTDPTRHIRLKFYHITETQRKNRKEEITIHWNKKLRFFLMVEVRAAFFAGLRTPVKQQNMTCLRETQWRALFYFKEILKSLLPRYWQ